ncbi:MAG: AraC family transcriptional regulator [Clostridium butyricum]|nr:AraC family transcriptional regulator [Clostridium butyricum]
MTSILKLAINKLGTEFQNLNLTFHDYNHGKKDDKISYWPGILDDDIMMCVFKGTHIHEPFHRQDFFFFNYAYRQNYQALSAKYNNLITIYEDECYIGQPYSGYALRGESNTDIVIVGILIKKDVFFREYLPTLSTDSSMFHFFLDPQTNKFSDEFIHLSFTRDHPVRALLELMIIEYADKTDDTQSILKPMILALFMHIARRYRLENVKAADLSLSEQIIQYMADHSDVVSLKDIGAHFSYHPNYISALLHQETGKTFSEILLEKRMKRAVLLLKNTKLSVEEIAVMLGYSNNSNFYKAFKNYYHTSPREYFAKN